jgi:uncharacterized membrane protein YfcA
MLSKEARPLNALDLVLVALAAVAAGVVNALAGGGTLITFPTLTAIGIPAVAANVTNTIALAPGHLGATAAQAADLRGQRRRLRLLLPAALLGGLAGGVLLLVTSERLFRRLVPFLILLASALLAVQEPLRKWLIARLHRSGPHVSHEVWPVLPVFAASVYGGYFGAGLSVIVLAALGLLIDDSLTRLNALKQGIGFAANAAAALLFALSGQVVWLVALVMAIGAILGGVLGGRLAGRIPPAALRRVVVAIGLAVSLVYFARG